MDTQGTFWNAFDDELEKLGVSQRFVSNMLRYGKPNPSTHRLPGNFAARATGAAGEKAQRGVTGQILNAGGRAHSPKHIKMLRKGLDDAHDLPDPGSYGNPYRRDLEL